ncbi:hypothetical protein SCP_0116520 [Sparassis crispa]|uniref:AMP-dependent synthetase/ligase domain-containing protein n=1 Tax=Sparassis crispa TaxID=139825 RepID=A0A401G9B7_9APHY|nr:hypothetical protein SCP_0116520 [Sparassis crispa]GBE78760.1 hypothetical protein SCP_0116520 [Sparassis crispa]
MHALPRDSFPGLVEQALLGDSPINARYKHPPLSFVPPTGNLLQDCFAERARSDPLATAIAHVELEGYVSPSCNVSYAAVVALSLELAEKLGSVDVGVGDVVAICVEDVRHVAISTLAVLVCGAAYVILDPGSTYNTALSSLSAVLPGLHVVLSAPRGCGPSAEPGSHLVFVDPGELTLDEASVYCCSKSCIPPSLRPDCIQPSATAYLKPALT